MILNQGNRVLAACMHKSMGRGPTKHVQSNSLRGRSNASASNLNLKKADLPWEIVDENGNQDIWCRQGTPQPPVSHSVGLLFLYGALDGHPFFPPHVASGCCFLLAAAAGALAGVVSAFAEHNGWCAGVVVNVAWCAVCASAVPKGPCKGQNSAGRRTKLGWGVTSGSVV